MKFVLVLFLSSLVFNFTGSVSVSYKSDSSLPIPMVLPAEPQFEDIGMELLKLDIDWDRANGRDGTWSNIILSIDPIMSQFEQWNSLRRDGL